MQTRISLLILLLVTSFACQQQEPSNHPNIKKGMIKVSILYPNGAGKTFDMDYYANKHMPMAASLFGDALKAMVIDEGIAGRTKDSPIPYLATGYFYFEDMATFQSAMGVNSEKLRADVPNYTNNQPVIQVSKVQTVE